MGKKFMVVDGNSIMNRAFYGLQGSQLLSTSDGLYTNAILGFINILTKYKEEEKPDYLCIAFDLKAPTFRHIEFDGYKAHRKGMPDELRVQVPYIKEVIDAMNIKRVEVEGFEADDILGTVAKYCEEHDIETVIVTGDKDSFQLISPKTRIKIPTTKMGKTETHEYTLEKFREVYGIEPVQHIDVKGIMGDPSDNIPGIPGVGEKTALDLIKQYKSVEAVLDNAENLEIRKNMKESIINNKELGLLSKRLATLECNVPFELSLDNFTLREFDKEKLYELFKRLEFKSLIEKFGLKGEVKKSNVEVKVITSENEIDKITNKIKSENCMTYHILFGNEEKNVVEGIGIYFDDGIVFVQNDKLIDKFRHVFEDNKISKIGYDLKHDIVALNSQGVGFENPGFDVMIAAYIMNPSREEYALSSITQEYLGELISSISEFWGKGKNINITSSFETSALADFIGQYTDCINKLKKIFKDKIKENDQERLFYDIEMPLVEVLANMEIEGFKVDKEGLKTLSKELEEKINILIEEIYKFAGEEFNINSTKQLGTILFDKLNLPVVKKTKTGYSTDAEVLEVLAPQHEMVAKILEYRQMVKLKSTYAEGLLNVINPVTGKIHSSFNQTVTQTGRISSTEPNLQNIPVRLEMGRNFRKVFIARDADYILLDADYSQIELRVLAHIAEDPVMIEAFKNNQDIHRKTASEVFNVPMEEVTAVMRRRAKAVNFGIVYGIGEFSLAKDIGVSRKEAKQYIENYLDNFTGVRKYMHDTIESGKTKGFVSTMLNRRRYLPELQSSNFNIRSFGERVAMNMPIQGTAADIIKIAMVNVYRELKERGLKSKLILQVHDELIIETNKSEIEVVKMIVYNEMTCAMSLKVPLVIDMHTGASWYEAK